MFVFQRRRSVLSPLLGVLLVATGIGAARAATLHKVHEPAQPAHGAGHWAGRLANAERIGQKRPGAAAATKKKEPVVDVAAETASHREVDLLPVEFGSLTALCCDRAGRLLACDGENKQIKVIDAQGRLVWVIELPFKPEALDVADDGSLYCGGEGTLAVLGADGSLQLTRPLPEDAATPLSQRRRASKRPLRVSGIAVGPRDVFVAFGSGWSLGSKSKLFRFDRRLGSATLLAEGLRACCQRCDIVTRDGLVYVAENSTHRVLVFDREGNLLDKWGKQSRNDIAGFGSCCNPMNLAFGPGGVLYTAESGLGRVKRYSTSGEYLGLVGYVGVERFTRAGRTAASCSNIAIAITPCGHRVYVMDKKENKVRVLEQKGSYPCPWCNGCWSVACSKQRCVCCRAQRLRGFAGRRLPAVLRRRPCKWW